MFFICNVKFCQFLLLTMALCKVCDILFCHFILLSPSCQAPSFVLFLHFKIQIWLLHFELKDCYMSFFVVVQVSSFKHCCYIQTLINDVFWISPTHAHQFFLLIFFFDVVFVFMKLFTWIPMFFHISCAIIIPKFVEVQQWGFLFFFCTFDLAFCLECFYEHCVFFSFVFDKCFEFL